MLFASITTGRVISRDQLTIIRDVPNEYLVIIKVLQERGIFAMEGKGEDVKLEPASDPRITSKPKIRAKMMQLTS